MKCGIAFAVMAVMSFAACAELRAPAANHRQVLDEAMVVDDRGSRLEIYPAKRATEHGDALQRGIRHRVFSPGVNAAIGSRQLLVVFNHSLQQQGYANGEITFQMKGTSSADVVAAQMPGARQISSSGIFALQATTPAEFVGLMRQLARRQDLKWFEPTIVYGPEESGPLTGN